MRLGCNLLTTLLASPDGVRFLMIEDDFLDQIVKSFAQLDPVRLFFLFSKSAALTPNDSLTQPPNLIQFSLKHAYRIP